MWNHDASFSHPSISIAMYMCFSHDSHVYHIQVHVMNPDIPHFPWVSFHVPTSFLAEEPTWAPYLIQLLGVQRLG